MKKRRLLALLFFFSIVLLGWNNVPIQATETHSQTLIIVKYSLTSDSHGFSSSQSFNTGLKINNIIVDDKGAQLQRLANITYTVQKIIEKDSGPVSVTKPSSYAKVGKPINIVTNHEGLASITLSDGKYILSEQANLQVGLSQPQAPVLLDLPTVDRLSEIYIYPKSSLSKNQSSPSENYPKQRLNNHKQDLPRTGEVISWFIALVGATFLITIAFVLNRKEKGESSQIK